MFNIVIKNKVIVRRDSAFCLLSVLIAVSIFSFFVTSCASKKDFVELRMEINKQNVEAESRFSSLEQSVAVLDSLIHEQHSLTKSIRALMGTQAIEQYDNISLIAARQDDINYLLRELLQKLEAIQLYGGVETKPTMDTPSPAPTMPPSALPETSILSALPAQTFKVNPKKLYDSALEDILNESYQLAESRFLSFLMQFPNHELAGNAQYWLGEAVYVQKKYELAISEFEKVLKKYPKSPKVPAAMLKIGFAQFELGKKKTAINTLNRLIKSYTKSEEAKLARERLNTP